MRRSGWPPKLWSTTACALSFKRSTMTSSLGFVTKAVPVPEAPPGGASARRSRTRRARGKAAGRARAARPWLEATGADSSFAPLDDPRAELVAGQRARVAAVEREEGDATVRVLLGDVAAF